MSRKRSLDQFFRELRFWDVSLIYKIRAFVIFSAGNKTTIHSKRLMKMHLCPRRKENHYICFWGTRFQISMSHFRFLCFTKTCNTHAYTHLVLLMNFIVLSVVVLKIWWSYDFTYSCTHACVRTDQLSDTSFLDTGGYEDF